MPEGIYIDGEVSPDTLQNYQERLQKLEQSDSDRGLAKQIRQELINRAKQAIGLPVNEAFIPTEREVWEEIKNARARGQRTVAIRVQMPAPKHAPQPQTAPQSKPIQQNPHTGYEEYYKGRYETINRLNKQKMGEQRQYDNSSSIITNKQAQHRTHGAQPWKKVKPLDETFTQQIIRKYLAPKPGESRLKTFLKGVGATSVQTTIGLLEFPWYATKQWEDAIEKLKNLNNEPTEEDIYNAEKLFSKLTTTTITNEQFVMAEEEAKKSSQEFTYQLGQLVGMGLIFGGVYGIQKFRTLRAQKAFREQFFDEQSVIWGPSRDVFNKFPEITTAPHGEKALVKTGVLYRDIGGGVFKFPVRESVFAVKETPVPNFYDNFVFGRTLSGKTVVRVKGTPTSLWKVADNIKPFKEVDIFRMKGGGANTPWWKTGNAPYPGFIKDEIFTNLADFAKSEKAIAVQKSSTVEKFAQMRTIEKTFTMKKAEAIKSFYAQMPTEKSYYQFGVPIVSELIIETEHNYPSNKSSTTTQPKTTQPMNVNFEPIDVEISFRLPEQRQKTNTKQKSIISPSLDIESSQGVDTSPQVQVQTQVQRQISAQKQKQITTPKPLQITETSTIFDNALTFVPVQKPKPVQALKQKQKTEFIVLEAPKTVEVVKFEQVTPKFDFPRLDFPRVRQKPPKKEGPRSKPKQKRRSEGFLIPAGEIDLFAADTLDFLGIEAVKVNTKRFIEHHQGPTGLFDEPLWLAEGFEEKPRKKVKKEQKKKRKKGFFDFDFNLDLDFDLRL